MAIYYPGSNDYISQLQPTAPDIAFDSQVIGGKQAQYDKNHARVSTLYGSILNSPVTREENIRAKDEFFKIIDNDIKRMAGLDFSLNSNVQAAASVFQSIYTNKNIVKDMVWTKNFNNEMNRAEAFKNCTDPDACGGQYWEEGERYMQYKRQEFKNATSAEAMSFSNVKYVPYKNIMNEAIKLAKESGLSIKTDKILGSYVVTTKNGQQLISPLTKLFNETLGRDPQLQEMYKTKAYVDRKDWIYNKLRIGEYSNENEAHLGYIREKTNQVQTALLNAADNLEVDLGHLTEKFELLKSQYNNGQFVEGSEKYNQLIELQQLTQSAQGAKQYTDLMLKATQNQNNQMAIRTLGDILDTQAAAQYFQRDINDAAQVIAFKDAESTIKPDDFAVLAKKHSYDVQMERISHGNKMALEKWKLEHGIYNDKINGGKENEITFKEINDSESKVDLANKFNFEARVYKLFKGVEPTAADIDSFDPPTEGESLKKYNKARKDALAEQRILRRNANVASIKAGKNPYFLDVLSLADMQKLGNFYADVYRPWLVKTAQLTEGELNALEKKDFSSDEPLFYQATKEN